MLCTHIGRIDTNPAAVDILLGRIPSPITGELVQGLASKPGCIDSFWKSIRRAFDSDTIKNAAARLRRNAQTTPTTIDDQMFWLFNSGFSREDIRQIRYVVEVYHYLEPVFAILAALAERWLAQDYDIKLSSDQILTCKSPELIALHDYDFELADESVDKNFFYRALAVWPEYHQRLLCEVDAHISETSSHVIKDARSLSRAIFLTPALHPESLDKQALMMFITSCLEKSAEVVVTASVLRKRFIAEEVANRNKRINK